MGTLIMPMIIGIKRCLLRVSYFSTLCLLVMRNIANEIQ